MGNLQTLEADGSTKRYVPAAYVKEVTELTNLYKEISPLRTDSLEEMFSSKTTKVVWLKIDKTWRCAIVFCIEDDDEVAVFLPYPGTSESVAAGTRGPVDPHDVIGAYLQVIAAFKTKLPKSSKQVTA